MWHRTGTGCRWQGKRPTSRPRRPPRGGASRLNHSLGHERDLHRPRASPDNRGCREPPDLGADRRRFTWAVLIGIAVITVPYLWTLWDLWSGGIDPLEERGAGQLLRHPGAGVVPRSPVHPQWVDRRRGLRLPGPFVHVLRGLPRFVAHADPPGHEQSRRAAHSSLDPPRVDCHRPVHVASPLENASSCARVCAARSGGGGLLRGVRSNRDGWERAGVPRRRHLPSTTRTWRGAWP